MKIKDLDEAQRKVLIGEELLGSFRRELDDLADRLAPKLNADPIPLILAVADDLADPLSEIFGIREKLNRRFGKDVSNDISSTIFKLFDETAAFVNKEVEI